MMLLWRHRTGVYARHAPHFYAGGSQDGIAIGREEFISRLRGGRRPARKQCARSAFVPAGSGILSWDTFLGGIAGDFSRVQRKAIPAQGGAPLSYG